MNMDLSFSDWQIKRFLSRSSLARRMQLRSLQKEADKRPINEPNKFLEMTIIEVIAKNCWLLYEKRQELLINDPANNFSDAKKQELSEYLKTYMTWVFQSIVDLWHEMKRLTMQHEQIIDNLIDP